MAPARTDTHLLSLEHISERPAKRTHLDTQAVDGGEIPGHYVEYPVTCNRGSRPGRNLVL
jgi:hypothetical protein